MRRLAIALPILIAACGASPAPEVRFGDCSCPRPSGSSSNALAAAPSASSSAGATLTREEVDAALDARWGAPWREHFTLSEPSDAKIDGLLVKLGGKWPDLEARLRAESPMLIARMVDAYRQLAKAKDGTSATPVFEAEFTLRSQLDAVADRLLDVAFETYVPRPLRAGTSPRMVSYCEERLIARTAVPSSAVHTDCESLAARAHISRMRALTQTTFRTELDALGTELRKQAKSLSERLHE